MSDCGLTGIDESLGALTLLRLSCNIFVGYGGWRHCGIGRLKSALCSLFMLATVSLGIRPLLGDVVLHTHCDCPEKLFKEKGLMM